MANLTIDNLKNGDILHCYRNKWISKAIRFITRSKFTSHTAICVVLEGHKFIVDSQADGTHFRFAEEWMKKYNYEFKISRPFSDYYFDIVNNDFLSRIKPYLNSKYGYLDLVRHLILNYTGVWIGGRREEKHLTCSEFVMRVFGEENAYKMNPYDVYVWCLEREFLRISKKIDQ